jgi:hypothetical protein
VSETDAVVATAAVYGVAVVSAAVAVPVALSAAAAAAAAGPKAIASFVGAGVAVCDCLVLGNGWAGASTVLEYASASPDPSSMTLGPLSARGPAVSGPLVPISKTDFALLARSCGERTAAAAAAGEEAAAAAAGEEAAAQPSSE